VYFKPTFDDDNKLEIGAADGSIHCSYKLGGAWALLAVRERRNLLWAVLAVIAWMALVVSLDLARTVGSLGIR